MSSPRKTSSHRWPLFLIVIGVVAAGGYLGWRWWQARSAATGQLKTATVVSITAVSSVEASGAITAQQSGSIYWKTTGTVQQVLVKAGDRVKAGDVLMTLDPASAPASIIQARADLINARRALEDLLHPDELAIANARQAVAQAQKALDAAQKDLNGLRNPDIEYYREQVRKAQDALTTALENETLTDVGSLGTTLRNAQDQAKKATDIYNDALAAFELCPDCTKVFVNAAGRRMEWKEVQKQYDDAMNYLRQVEIQVAQATRQNSNAVATAQDKLEKAQRNLDWALKGPKAADLALKEAAVAVAEANLAKAKEKLDHLLNGADPDDVNAAQARVQALQTTVDMLNLKAPFAGEVLEVNYLPGDAVSQSQAAVVLADRSRLYVDVLVDESEIAPISAGNPATITVDALPDLNLAGVVKQISPVGKAIAGLVKYTVRVELTEAERRLLLGMTANVSIVTAVEHDQLAVPIDAVHSDERGEFVQRITMPGAAPERVEVISGQMQGDLVVVSGALRPGDQVVVIENRPSIGRLFGRP